MQGFLQSFLVMPAAAPDPGYGLAGAEVKVEQGKADPIGCRAYWGKGNKLP